MGSSSPHRSSRWRHSPPTSRGCARCASRQTGLTIIVGHSYGGQIMTALRTDGPNAVALVYIAAFGLDEGESIGALLNGDRRTRPLHISTSTPRASPGFPKTTSSITSPTTSIRST
jgi:pimeloyl-ACP methyl ester carboxylesterase